MAYKGQTKYRKTWPAELINCLAQGHSYATFCSDKEISEQGFYDFLDKHPEFNEAYATGKMKNKKWMENIARDHMSVGEEDNKLNTTLWSMLMRNRHDLTEHRKVKIPGISRAKSSKGKMKKIMEQVQAGKLTAAEALQLANLIETDAIVFEKTELIKRVEQIENATATGVKDDEFKEE